MKIRFLIIVLLVLIIAGCEKHKPVNDKKQEPSIEHKQEDNRSLMINYNVSGSGNGKILLAKKGPYARFEITKTTADGNNVESMFYDNNYLYFYVMGLSGLQPAKMMVTRDISYRKNFASFIDAAEYTKFLTPAGKDTVAGKVCDKFIYKEDGSSFSVFDNNYVLKASFDGMVITANNVKENPQIDDAFVRVPQNINFIDISK